MTATQLRDGPRVSVVMSTFRGARFLPAQLDSILAQSHRDLEILIRDDASGDGTPALLREYATSDRRVRLLPSRDRLGLVASLEILLGEARGEYVAIADQDDVWRPEKVATLLDRIGSHAAIYSASRLIDADGNDLGRTLLEAYDDREPVSGRDPIALFWNNTVSGHAVLFRRSLVPRIVPFDRELLYDHQIGIRALAAGGLAYCELPLVLHRIHGRNQVNGGVLGGSRPLQRDRDLARSFAGKLRRRRTTRRNLLRRLEFYQRNALLASLDPAEIRRAERASRAYRRSFLNPALFLLLLRQPRLFAGRLDRLSRAFRYAKGARWLKLRYRRRAPLGGRRAGRDRAAGRSARAPRLSPARDSRSAPSASSRRRAGSGS